MDILDRRLDGSLALPGLFDFANVPRDAHTFPDGESL